MSWEIVVGLITLVGFLATVSSWVWKLSGTLTKLTDGLKSLSEFKCTATAEHQKLRDDIDDHEGRIVSLEYHTGLKK